MGYSSFAGIACDCSILAEGDLVAECIGDACTIQPKSALSSPEMVEDRHKAAMKAREALRGNRTESNVCLCDPTEVLTDLYDLEIELVMKLLKTREAIETLEGIRNED